MPQKYLYVVFSRTPYRIGRAIRVVTGFSYNHVSLALEQDGTLYSFARKYGNVPFYAGFVQESPLRYRHRGRLAEILVCRIPVTEEQHRAVAQKLDSMQREPRRYLYNLFSAATAPLHHRVLIPQCYTCVEFVAAMLVLGGVLREEERSRFWAISALAERLAPHEYYRGIFPIGEESLWCDDAFPLRRSHVVALGLTCLALGRLTMRYVKK